MANYTRQGSIIINNTATSANNLHKPNIAWQPISHAKMPSINAAKRHSRALQAQGHSISKAAY